MFAKDDLYKVSQINGFTVWLYDAGSNPVEANAARNVLGFFPTDTLKPGDALYIRSRDLTTHHWVQLNEQEKKLSVWLFGG